MKFVVVCLAFLCAPVLGDAPTTGPQTEQQQMEPWWADLEKSEPQSTRAILNFADKPVQAVAFFKEAITRKDQVDRYLNTHSKYRM
jgi:hypothetical protein